MPWRFRLAVRGPLGPGPRAVAPPPRRIGLLPAPQPLHRHRPRRRLCHPATQATSAGAPRCRLRRRGAQRRPGRASTQRALTTRGTRSTLCPRPLPALTPMLRAAMARAAKLGLRPKRALWPLAWGLHRPTPLTLAAPAPAGLSRPGGSAQAPTRPRRPAPTGPSRSRLGPTPRRPTAVPTAAPSSRKNPWECLQASRSLPLRRGGVATLTAGSASWSISVAAGLQRTCCRHRGLRWRPLNRLLRHRRPACLVVPRASPRHRKGPRTAPSARSSSRADRNPRIAKLEPSKMWLAGLGRPGMPTVAHVLVARRSPHRTRALAQSAS